MPRVPQMPVNVAIERSDFSAGLNEVDIPKNQKDNELSLTENIFPRVGIIQFAKGKLKLTNITVNVDLAAMVVFVDRESNDRIVYLEGNDINLLQIDPDSSTLIGNISATSSKAQFKQKEENLILVSDKQNVEMQSTTTSPFFTVRNLSPTKPVDFGAAQLVEVNIGSGNLSKDKKYQYAITKAVVDADGNLVKESGLSPIPSITLVDDSDVDINLIGFVGDAQINKIRIYRSLGGTDLEPTTDLFFLAEVNNANQTFNDTTSDPILSVETDLQDTQGFEALPNSEHLEILQERIYVVDKDNPNRLVYSHNIRGKFTFIFATAGENLVTTTNNIISVSGFSITPNGQPINGIRKHGNDLYAFTNSRTYYIRDNKPENGMFEIPETLGAKSKFGAIEKDGRLLVNTYEVERRGIRFVDGLEYSNDLTNEQLEKTFSSIVDFSKIIMLETGNNMWMLYNDDATKSFNNKAIILQFHKERLLSWTIMTNALGDVAVTDSQDRMIIYSNNDNSFYLQNNDFTNGEKITAKWAIAPVKGKTTSEQVEVNQLIVYGKNLDGLRAKMIANDGAFFDMSFVNVPEESSNWLESNYNETDNDIAVVGATPDEQIFRAEFTTEVFGHIIVPEFSLTYTDVEPEVYRIEMDTDIRRFR